MILRGLNKMNAEILPHSNKGHPFIMGMRNNFLSQMMKFRNTLLQGAVEAFEIARDMELIQESCTEVEKV